MPQFAYKARKRTGEAVSGVLDVPDRSAALLQLERLGLFPVAVEQPKAGAAPAPDKTVEPGQRDFAKMLPVSVRNYLNRPRKPKMQEVATFTQQLANLLKSGMPLTVALNSMTHLETRGIPASISRQLKQDVMEGSSLSDAMARQSVIFTPMYVNMVRAGEQSGALEEVLRRLAEHFTRFAEVQQKFRSAMIYPTFVAVVGITIVIVFMTVLLPKFMTMFNGMEIDPPLTTQILIGTSHLLTRYWWLMLAVILALMLLFKRYQSTEEGRRRIDAAKMRIPVFGRVLRLNLFGQFTRTLCTLLENGVPVLTALKISEQIMPNVILRDAIAKTREEVTDGKTLAQPLAHSKVFPQLMIDLIRIGEETGDVPGSLRNLADTYENELSMALKVMMNMIEPVMIVIMSLGVGFLLLSVLSMMFKMISGIQVTGGGGR